MAHSVFTSICCRSEGDESFSAFDPDEPSTSAGQDHPDLLNIVKVTLEDGAVDGKKPTVVEMRDETFQLQKGRTESNKNGIIESQY